MEAPLKPGNISAYAEGDWLVHGMYGLGQITGQDVKSISGAATPYWRVRTADSTYWIPVEHMDSELIRPLASAQQIEEAIAILQRPPQPMSASHIVRRSNIQTVREDNTPQALARLARDLRERQRQKGILGQAERSAYGTCRQRLVEEWSLVCGLELDRVTALFESMMNPGKATGA